MILLLLMIPVAAAVFNVYDLRTDKFVYDVQWPFEQNSVMWFRSLQIPFYYIEPQFMLRHKELPWNDLNDIFRKTKKEGAYPSFINPVTDSVVVTTLPCYPRIYTDSKGAVRYINKLIFTLPNALQWFGLSEWKLGFRYIPYEDGICIRQDTIERPSDGNGACISFNPITEKLVVTADGFTNVKVSPGTYDIFDNSFGTYDIETIIKNVSRPTNFSVTINVPFVSYTRTMLVTKMFSVPIPNSTLYITSIPNDGCVLASTSATTTNLTTQHSSTMTSTTMTSSTTKSSVQDDTPVNQTICLSAHHFIICTIASIVVRCFFY